MPSQDASKENNFAQLILRHLPEKASKIALHLPTEWDQEHVTASQSLTYGALAERSAALLAGLRAEGFRSGDRIVILFPLSMDLYILLIALLAGGMCPVFIDPGMSLRRIAYSIQAAQAKALISFSKFLKLRFILPALWKLKRYSVDSAGWGVRPFSTLSTSTAEVPTLEASPCRPEEHAIITFTSGSTGHPKAADRNHRLLIAQCESIARIRRYGDDDVCMTCLPVFPLYNLTCGITTVLPAADFRHLGKTNGKLIAEQIETFSVNCLGGGPAFVERICDYFLQHSPSLSRPMKFIGLGGAPVSKKLGRKIHTCFPETDAWIIYGSTEAEPVSHIDIPSVLNTPARGNLVGEPVEDVRVKIVKMPEKLPLPEDKKTPPRLDLKSLEAPTGESGEILLQGEHVLDHYLLKEDTQRCKILDEDQSRWHRIGDVAHFNAEGQLVLVGRYNDFVYQEGQKVYPLTIETPVNDIPGIKRSAYLSLDGETNASPVLVLELEEAPPATIDRIKPAIESIFEEIDLPLPPCCKLPEIPVDGRHNSKIDRATLRKRLAKGKRERYRF